MNSERAIVSAAEELVEAMSFVVGPWEFVAVGA
jgi:hypothetical protein